MSRKQAKAKPTASRSTVKPKEDPLAYEMWLTGELDHGPVLERGAAEGYLKNFKVEDPRSGRETRH